MKKAISSLAVIGLCASMSLSAMLTNPIIVYSEQSQVFKPTSGIGTLLYPQLSDEEIEELMQIAASILRDDMHRDSLKNAVERTQIAEETEMALGYQNRWGITELSDEERELLADIVWLEAGNQGLEGQELVVVTILNRTMEESFNDDVVGVMSQENQFETWPNKYNASPTDETYEAIENVLSGNVEDWIYDADFLYFNTSSGRFQWKDHWFR